MTFTRAMLGFVIAISATSSGCGGAESMNGFRAADARARVVADPIDAGRSTSIKW